VRVEKCQELIARVSTSAVATHTDSRTALAAGVARAILLFQTIGKCIMVLAIARIACCWTRVSAKW
jgi:hypothetical protein